jgi:hypothetical protein
METEKQKQTRIVAEMLHTLGAKGGYDDPEDRWHVMAVAVTTMFALDERDPLGDRRICLPCRRVDPNQR